MKNIASVRKHYQDLRENETRKEYVSVYSKILEGLSADTEEEAVLNLDYSKKLALPGVQDYLDEAIKLLLKIIHTSRITYYFPWIIAVQRIDNSKTYATQETVERFEGYGTTSHDKKVKELLEQYKDDDHVRIVGPGHMFYKDTNLGVHYI